MGSERDAVCTVAGPLLKVTLEPVVHPASNANPQITSAIFFMGAVMPANPRRGKACVAYEPHEKI
jgi:hypothetical protein